VVQGHGEIVLRGEINETINSSINYLNKMQLAVASALTANLSRDDMLRDYDIESCGKSRIALNGLVQQLHAANLIATYDRLSVDRSKLAALKARSAAAARAKPERKAKAKTRTAKKPGKAKSKAKVAKKSVKAKSKATAAKKPVKAKARKTSPAKSRRPSGKKTRK
jgi:hypothetical protein